VVPRELHELVCWGTKELDGISPSPKLDAQLLLAHACGISKEKVLTDANQLPSQAEESNYLNLIARRKKSEPVAYLVGKKEFWGIDIIVTPSVLIPRPESELLVQAALEASKLFKDPLAIADLGTGSGCLAIAIAQELKKLRRDFLIVAIDRSAEALKIAKQNIDAHELCDQIQLLQGDWLSSNAVKGACFQIIVTNPPYLAENEARSPETNYEPPSALFSGEGGLADAKKIFAQCLNFLVPDGRLLCEVGGGKRDEVRNAFSNSWNLEFIGDMASENGYSVINAVRKDRS